MTQEGLGLCIAYLHTISVIAGCIRKTMTPDLQMDALRAVQFQEECLGYPLNGADKKGCCSEKSAPGRFWPLA